MLELKQKKGYMQLSKLRYRDLLFLASSSDLENIVFRKEESD